VLRTDGPTDGQTERQTDRIAVSISRVSVLTRDKNVTLLTHVKNSPVTVDDAHGINIIDAQTSIVPVTQYTEYTA